MYTSAPFTVMAMCTEIYAYVRWPGRKLHAQRCSIAGSKQHQHIYPAPVEAYESRETVTCKIASACVKEFWRCASQCQATGRRACASLPAASSQAGAGLCRMLAMSYSRRTFVFILPASASARPPASVQHIVPGQCKILEWTWTLCIQSQGGVSASPSLAAWQL